MTETGWLWVKILLLTKLLQQLLILQMEYQHKQDGISLKFRYHNLQTLLVVFLTSVLSVL